MRATRFRSGGAPVVRSGGFERITAGQHLVTIEIGIEAGLRRLVPCRADDLAQATLTAPSSPGEYDIQAAPADGAILATTSLVVQEGAPGSEEPLPETGPQGAIAVTAVGGGLLIAGIVLLATARTRRPSTR